MPPEGNRRSCLVMLVERWAAAKREVRPQQFACRSRSVSAQLVLIGRKLAAGGNASCSGKRERWLRERPAQSLPGHEAPLVPAAAKGPARPTVQRHHVMVTPTGIESSGRSRGSPPRPAR